MKVISLLLAATACASHVVAQQEGHSVQYSNHLFNAVHSAMRQWGSSLLHNGMTAFIATVPEDTEFYHGTSSEYRINGTQWLAFEPEHALLFANQLHGSPPGGKHGERQPGPPRGGRYPQPRDNEDGTERCIPGKACGRPLRMRDNHMQMVLENGQPEDNEPPPVGHGYLHTYRTKHALRLLYVDGQSAAKSEKGTLDMQDVVLLRGKLDTGDGYGHGRNGPMNEHARAKGLCKRAKKQWEGKIDGILRMEGGFEIILCSFEEHLDVVKIEQAKDRESRMFSDDRNLFRGEKEPSTNMLSYYKAVASRYDGIGGGRVQLDFEKMVSLYSYTDALYFNDIKWPRAKNDTKSVQQARDDIDDMAKDVDRSTAGINWQALADMVVSRWSDRLQALSQAKSLSDMQDQLTLALAPYIDYADRNSTREIQRCASQYLPKNAYDSGWRRNVSDGSIYLHYALPPAGEAVARVSMSICRELSLLSARHDLKGMKKTTKSLMDWLGWTTWKRCKGCDANEVCFLPIWPAGNVEDYERPSCKSLVNWGRDSGDYWHDR